MPTTPAPRIRLCHDCGAATESTSRCPDCAKKRRPVDRKRRRAISRAVFPRPLRTALLTQLRSGRPLGEAAQSIRVPAPQIHGFARTNPAFRRELDEALLAGRDPNLTHGTQSAYRYGRCRCPECREAKARSGAWSR